MRLSYPRSVDILERRNQYHSRASVVPIYNWKRNQNSRDSKYTELFVVKDEQELNKIGDKLLFLGTFSFFLVNCTGS